MPRSPTGNTLLDAIHDHNRSYLILARELLLDDYPRGILQLGITAEVARLLLDMPISHLLELSATPSLICSLALNTETLLEWRNRLPQHAELYQAQRSLHLLAPNDRSHTTVSSTRSR